MADEKDFLRSISMRPNCVSLGEHTLARAEQLCAKTNQYNLRVIRYSRAELRHIGEVSGEMVFLSELSDRFGEHGIVGMVIARPAGKAAFLDTFLMSCRVLGRHLEGWMINMLIRRLRSGGVQWLLAEFCPTGRNVVAKDFLAENGFTIFSFELDPSGGLLGALASKMACKGDLYFANLDLINIPHLEIFDNA